MQRYHDCPQVLREFLIYHENIKGQSPLTISEYYLDLRMFLRFIKLMRNDMPMSTNLDDIDIKEIDIQFIRDIDTSDILIFFPTWPRTGSMSLAPLPRTTAFPPKAGPESCLPSSPSINI